MVVLLIRLMTIYYGHESDPKSTMRIPQTPPSPSSSALDRAISWELFSRAVPGPLVKGEYIHWDRLRHLTPPEGIDHETWWTWLKLRRSDHKLLPLTDREGRPFMFLAVDPIPERLHEIDMGAGGLIAMPEQITNPETRDQYYVGSRMQQGR